MTDQKLATYDFEEMPVRVIDQDGQPWFVLGDVCRVLEITNPSEASSRLDDDEKNTIRISEGIRGNPNMVVVSESGLLTMILRSHDAVTPGTTAHRFRKWVTGEVLPAIRRTGKYVHHPVTGGADDEEGGEVDIIERLGADHVRIWVEMVREARRLAGNSAGLSIWRRSPLPQFDATPPEERGDMPVSEVTDFLQNRTEPVSGGSIKASVFYGAYCSWAEFNNRAVLSNKVFALTLLGLGMERLERSGGRFWKNLRLTHC
ncbi:MAG: BRO family protein [Minwuia sp.]|nr:BRO family protein [Minwuia sp.]